MIFKSKYQQHSIHFLKIVTYNLLNRHFCSNVPNQPKKVFNPFKRRWFGPTSDNNQKKTARIVVTVLGNGAVGQPRCLGLFTDYRTFFFNCGEGVGRLCREYDINMYSVKNVFITQRTWENLSGLPDIYLSNEVRNISRMCLYGPPHVDKFLSVVSSPRQDMPIVHKDSFMDENISIKPIPVINESTITGVKKDVSYSYACLISENVGEFNSEKCVELGIPIGPHLLQLKNGEDVVLPSGRIVYAADVLDSAQPQMTLLIVDCPSEDFLNPFVEENTFADYQLPAEGARHVVYVYHFSPVHVMQMKKYQDWMKKFHQDTKHIILNSSNSGMSSEAVFQTQNVLNLIHPKIFKLLPEDKLELENLCSSWLIQPPPMLQMQIRPEIKIKWDNVVKRSSAVDWLEMLQELPEFYDKLNDFKSSFTMQDKGDLSETRFPEVLFLGTSSSTSSPFRNVTGILLKLHKQNSILLDCGEGTLMQMVRYFGKASTLEELRNISTIFISHKHTDHYLGLFTLLKARIEAFKNSGFPYRPVSLIMPRLVQNLFYNFCELFEPFKSKVKIFPCKNLVNKTQDSLVHILEGVKLLSVPVQHCAEAYGVVLESKYWKIVYSGDSAPCQRLIDAGADCTLLIHEASVEDNLLSEATMKLHSTPSQVVNIAKEMNAQHVIMTHFSKRYLAVPVFQERDAQNVGLAFDFMKVRLSDLPLLPKFVPLFKCLFREQLEDHLEKSSSVAQQENVFLRTYRANRYR